MSHLLSQDLQSSRCYGFVSNTVNLEYIDVRVCWTPPCNLYEQNLLVSVLWCYFSGICSGPGQLFCTLLIVQFARSAVVVWVTSFVGRVPLLSASQIHRDVTHDLFHMCDVRNLATQNKARTKLRWTDHMTKHDLKFVCVQEMDCGKFSSLSYAMFKARRDFTDESLQRRKLKRLGYGLLGWVGYRSSWYKKQQLRSIGFPWNGIYEPGPGWNLSLPSVRPSNLHACPYISRCFFFSHFLSDVRRSSECNHQWTILSWTLDQKGVGATANCYMSSCTWLAFITKCLVKIETITSK